MHKTKITILDIVHILVKLLFIFEILILETINWSAIFMCGFETEVFCLSYVVTNKYVKHFPLYAFIKNKYNYQKTK